MKKSIVVIALPILVILFYACNDSDDDNQTPTPTGPTQLSATLTNQATSTSATSGSSTATSTFAGSIDQTARTLSYTVTYAGITPTGSLFLSDTTAALPSPAVNQPSDRCYQ